jgi:AbrB family looped-hinge helix DNA binding protein
MQKQTRITRKGQITVPREVRRLLGVRAGDWLLFESDEKGIRVRPVRNESAFPMYRGIGNPQISSAERASAVGYEGCVDNDDFAPSSYVRLEAYRFFGLSEGA